MSNSSAPGGATNHENQETRGAPDANRYTWPQFLDYYGPKAQERWDQAGAREHGAPNAQTVGSGNAASSSAAACRSQPAAPHELVQEPALAAAANSASSGEAAPQEPVPEPPQDAAAAAAGRWWPQPGLGVSGLGRLGAPPRPAAQPAGAHLGTGALIVNL